MATTDATAVDRAMTTFIHSSPQARAATGYDRAAFTIGWTARQAICPQGQTSSSWTRTQAQQQALDAARTLAA
ncbi:hypothetical protein ABGB12_00425 [Actinocorallia sp. B10E7]|uniref:hypothetical protein n=1 Tax=Actinocorallia sp. B10E7 TaxID=3153558 RepID=UPI00325DE221